MAAPRRLCVVGAGYFAQFHLEAWSRLEAEGRVEVLGVCDRDAGRAEAAAAQFPAARPYNDAGAMLDDARPTRVDLATPPETRRELVGEAARRGIDAITQKPLADGLAEAEAIVQVAAEAGIRLVVHENFRHMPWYRKIARLIADGRLGRLHRASFRLRPGDGQGPEAYLARQPYFQRMPRFLVHETAIHLIDVYRHLFGDITGVFARLERLNPAIAGEDAGILVLGFASGLTALFDGNRLNDHVADNPRLTMGEMWVEGEQGMLRLDGAARLWWKPHGEAEREHPYDWPARGFGGDCVYATQRHILDRLEAGVDPDNTARAYLRNVAVEEAVYRSAESGRWIDLPGSLA